MSNIKRPTFTDRDVQYPNRVSLLPSEGSAVTYDVVPAPGTVTQEGTPVDSDLMNEMADYSELGYKNKLYVSADGYADDVFFETGEASEVNVYGQTRQNLWKNPSGTSNGVTVTSNEDGSFSLSGTAEKLSIVQTRTYVLQLGKAYVLQIDKTIGRGVFVSFKNSGGTEYKYVAVGGTLNSSLSAVFTVDGSFSFADLCVSVESGATASGTYRVMLREATEDEIAAAQQTASTLQEGGTADIPQEQIENTPMLLPELYADSGEFDWWPPGLTSVNELALNVSGKNLLESKEASGAGYTFSIGGDGSLVVSGTGDGSTAWKTITELSLPKGDYVFSQTSSNESSSLLSLLKGFTQLGKTQSVKFTVTSEDDVYRLAFNGSYAFVEGTEYTFQIERGTEATAYEPYVGSSTPIDLQGNVLSSLPDGTRDVLTVDANGACSIEKQTVTTVFDGVSNKVSESGTGVPGFFVTSLSYPGGLGSSSLPNLFCDSLPRQTRGNQGTSSYMQNGISANTSSVTIRLIDFSTADEANAWMQSNPITVVSPAIEQTVELDSIDPVIPPSTVTNMWTTVNSTLTPELDFTYDKRLSLGSNTTFGFVKGDGTTIDVINGVIQLAGDVISGIWDKVKPYADATYALINHTHTASQLPKATTSALGLVKPDGSTLSIDGNGTLSVAGGGSGYTLPPATTTTLGGIKVGDNLTVESDGTLNATGGGGSIPNPLPIEQGGTGAQTATAAEYNIIGDPLSFDDTPIADNSRFAQVYAEPSSASGVFVTRQASTVWTYIKSKADSVYRAATAKIPWTDLEDVPASFPPSAHTHSADDITSGTLPIARGGTGGATADAALTNLGVKGTASGNVAEHYKLGKLHFIRITGTVASLANNQTTVGPFNLGFNMPAQPSGASAASFTQGTLLSRYTSDAKATVNTLSYTSQSSISINLFAQQAISTSVTYDVWLAVSEA